MSGRIFLLCAPGGGLSCFACCPPIRPSGYDHAQHRGSLTRLLSENTQAWRQGRAPSGPLTGYWCPGLGFLDQRGQQVGCLLHPARNQGADLRGPTGYAEKCARESCPPARALALLSPTAQEALIALCAGLDSFAYSSLHYNPVMRLLALGPEVARAAAGLGLGHVRQMRGWAWLAEMEPAWGWLLGRALAVWGTGALGQAELSGRLGDAVQRLRQGLGPTPPLEQGQPLEALCDEWEARFWRHMRARRRARPSELARWRGRVEEVLG